MDGLFESFESSANNAAANYNKEMPCEAQNT